MQIIGFLIFCGFVFYKFWWDFERDPVGFILHWLPLVFITSLFPISFFLIKKFLPRVINNKDYVDSLVESLSETFMLYLMFYLGFSSIWQGFIGEIKANNDIFFNWVGSWVLMFLYGFFIHVPFFKEKGLSPFHSFFENFLIFLILFFIFIFTNFLIAFAFWPFAMFLVEYRKETLSYLLFFKKKI